MFYVGKYVLQNNAQQGNTATIRHVSDAMPPTIRTSQDRTHAYPVLTTRPPVLQESPLSLSAKVSPHNKRDRLGIQLSVFNCRLETKTRA